VLTSLVFSALLVPLGSHHANRDAGYEEFNPGLAAEFSVPDSPWSLVAGAYRNSYGKTAVFAQAAVMPLEYGPVKLGASLGLSTGYRSPIIGGLQARLWDRLNITIVPPTGPNTGVIGASLRIPFD
jgi:hypothetical protein